MEKTIYNLSSRPLVNLRTSRTRVWLVIGLILFMAALGGWRLHGFLTQQSSLRAQAAQLRQRQAEALKKSDQAEQTIKAQQKKWKVPIDWANGIVESTAPRVSLHLEQLEKLLPERVMLETLDFGKSKNDELSLTVLASSQDDLLELYRRLAVYDIKISQENAQKDGSYKASLTVRLPIAE